MIPIKVDTDELWIARQLIEFVSDTTLCGLEGCRTGRLRILPNLAGQVDQGNDDTDSAEKVTNVPEYF